MTWLGDFEDELRSRRLRASARERLLAEFADHIACEQGEATRLELTRLGAAREIAAQYAEELGTDDARRGALGVFAALAFTALVFAVQQVGLGRIGYPGFNHGSSTPLALIAILAFVLGAQLALVSGTLAAWRALRRRGEPVLPAAEIGLLRRRAKVAVGAGLLTTTGLLLYVINFASVLPAWWLVSNGVLAAVAAAGLGVAGRSLVRGGTTLVLADGPAGDIYDDLPPLRLLRGHPLRLWALAALALGGFVTLAEWHAEHSFAEGLQRGGFEALALTICFVLFGRAIGARR